MPYALRRPRLYYERHGAGEPLLVLTGFTISAAVFEPVLDLYAARFDCIAYDHRGAGRSGSAPWPTSMAELAADAARLLEAVGVDSAHVYGVSMGGMVAQELALRFPERVRGLVLGGTTAGGPLAARPPLAALWRQAAVVAADARAGRHALGAYLLSPELRARDPERAAELLRNFRPSPWGAAVQLWATAVHDTVSRLGQIQAPTLVFHGEQDVLSPRRNAELLAEGIPDAELVIVAGAAHAYALEQPQRSFDALVDWLERREPIPPGKARGGIAARLEPVTRPFGLHAGALRTGRSLARRLGA